MVSLSGDHREGVTLLSWCSNTSRVRVSVSVSVTLTEDGVHYSSSLPLHTVISKHRSLLSDRLAAPAESQTSLREFPPGTNNFPSVYLWPSTTSASSSGRGNYSLGS